MKPTIDIFAEDTRAQIACQMTEQEEGVCLLHVRATLPTDGAPRPFTLSFSVPVQDMYSTFSPAIGAQRHLAPVWRPQITDSRLAYQMPLHALVSREGENRLCVSVSDAHTPISISTGVVEETACMCVRITFFTKLCSVRDSYEATVRIDERTLPYEDVLRTAVAYWQTDCGYTPAAVPARATYPMNSLWYSYHQLLESERILEECRLSRPYGMDTVILDDGWQTLNSERGYAYCGDWEPERLPDMRHLVDRIHETGMAVMLWFSVPFVGVHSKTFERFREYLIAHVAQEGIYAFDPRYPIVREYLIETYRHALTAWDLDGLKLDFIDSFALDEAALVPDPRRDTESLEDAIDWLMTDVSAALRAVRPDVMIEFRQAYVGPAIARYGNILRVTDCPNDTIFNRRAAVDLRLCTRHTAVHSDMLMWHPEDTPESVSCQLLSTLPSVPQISVRLGTLSDVHRRVLMNYLTFWRAHRTLILGGTLYAKSPETLYSQVRIEGEGEAIVIVYEDPVVDASRHANLFVANGGAGRTLYLDSPLARGYRVYNAEGECVGEGTICTTTLAVAVPMGGRIELFA